MRAHLDEVAEDADEVGRVLVGRVELVEVRVNIVILHEVAASGAQNIQRLRNNAGGVLFRD